MQGHAQLFSTSLHATQGLGWLRWIVALCLAFGAVSAHAWNLDKVADMARERADAPFQPFSAVVPAELTALGYDRYREIQFKRERALWQPDKLPFEAMYFHVGLHGDSVRLHELTPSGARALPYSPADYSYGKNLPALQGWGDIGHGGFRVLSQLNSAASKDELISFLGASYFRALGAGQRYGLSARGLAVDTGGARAEEFPRFTDFWLEKPASGATQLTVWALLDSPRMTGAYRFTIQPGEQTAVEVQVRIFMRRSATPVATLGLAPLTSMFFFGENQPQRGDFRPEVHDSDGLMVATGAGEWLWRPLQNPPTPLLTSFAMKDLKGFGLMQRDRAFSSYEDTEARYELRPSAWVTPIGDWGPGKVELLQLPTRDETHDNVVAYWVPEKLPLPGQALAFAYQIAWQGNSQQRPPNAWATQSRRGHGYSSLNADSLNQQVQYVVDFTGPALEALPEDAPVRAIATSDANGRVLESLVYRNAATGSWRMTLRVQRLDPVRPVELRAFLQHNIHTVSETWTTLLITP